MKVISMFKRQMRLVAMAIITALSVPMVSLAGTPTLDDSCIVTVNGQSVQVNSDGTFVITNVSAADQFGAGGPGSAPDFQGDDWIKLSGICITDDGPVYVQSECFQIRQGEPYSIGGLTFSTMPPLAIESLQVLPETSTLTTIGESTVVQVSADFTDGTSSSLDPVTECVTFRTSNPAIVTIDQNGVATAHKMGTVVISASVEGLIAVTKVTVSPGDPLTTVVGFVHDADGFPVSGVDIYGTNVAGHAVTVGDGSFTMSGVATSKGPITVRAEVIIDTELVFGASRNLNPLSGLFTDAGIIRLGREIHWWPQVSGSWHDAVNWDVAMSPSAQHDVFIDVPGSDVTITYSSGETSIGAIHTEENFALIGGALLVDRDSEFNGALTLSGTLGGEGQHFITDELTWRSSGSFGGSGETFVTGSIDVSDNWYRYLDGRTIHMTPDIYWTSNYPLTMYNGAIYNNTSLFDISSNGTVMNGSGLLNNLGTFRKSGGSGTSTVSVPLNNPGDVDVLTGTMNFSSTGTHTGTVSVAEGAEIRIQNAGQVFAQESTISGDGDMYFNFGGTLTIEGDYGIGGNTNINAGHVIFDTPEAQSFPELTLGGTIGGVDHTITGAFTWKSGGTFVGPGETYVEGTIDVSDNWYRYLDNRTLHVTPDVHWTSSYPYYMSNGAVYNNTSVFDIHGNGSVIVGSGLFNNFGTFRKSSGGGASTIASPFNNPGDVEVLSGSMYFNSTATHSGTLTVGDGAEVRIQNVGQVFEPGSTISGDGNMYFNFGGTMTIPSDYEIGGVTNINAGHIEFETPGPLSFPALTLGGTIGGVDHTITGEFNWKSSGTLIGPGETHVEGTLSVTDNWYRYLNNRTLHVSPDVHWTSNYPIILSNGAVYNNTSLFDIQSNGTAISGSGLFNNFGTFRKSSGEGATAIGIPFNNPGDVEVLAGSMYFNSTATHTGTVTVGEGAEIRIQNVGQVFEPAAYIGGDGDVFFNFVGTMTIPSTYEVGGITNINAGHVVFETPEPLTFAGLTLRGTVSGVDHTVTGHFDWGSSGTLLGPGETFVEGTMDVSQNWYRYLDNRILHVTPDIHWTSNYPITMQNGAIYNNSGLFDIHSNGTVLSGSGLFNNFGMFRKSSGDGSSSIVNPFNNPGDVEVLAGSMYFNSTATHTGSISVGEGAEVRIQNAGQLFEPGSTISGAGDFYFSIGGSMTISSDYDVSGLTTINAGEVYFETPEPLSFADLTLRGAAGGDDHTITGALTWHSNGSFNGPGTTHVLGTVDVSDNWYRYLDNRTVNMTSDVSWTSNYSVLMSNNAVYNSNGLFDINTTGTVFSGTGQVNNFGTFRKSGGDGTSTLAVPFTNEGTVEVQAGTLRFSNDVTQLSGSILINNATLDSTQAIEVMGGNVEGAGTIDATLVSSSVVAPGLPIGTLNIEGNLALDTDSELQIELGGTLPGKEHDVIAIGGNATLVGILSVTLANGFEPQVGEVFEIMTYDSRGGTFQEFHGADLPNGLALEITYATDSIILTVIQP